VTQAAGPRPQTHRSAGGLRMSEAEFQQRVTDLCDTLGLTWAHFRPAVEKSGKWSTPMSGRKGFPDLVIAGPGGVLFVELKTDTGRLSHDQQHWLDELHDGGSECHVWRPRKWPMIQKRLTEIAHPRHIDVTPSR